MATLEGERRSASVRADRDTEALFLSRDDFRRLVEEHPAISTRILLAMARELSWRLRQSNVEVQALEE